MYQRIKYNETNKKGIFKSAKAFQSSSTQAKYFVKIDTNEMTYKVTNISDGSIIKSTSKDNKNPPQHLNTLKRQAKNALISLGVKFDLELRMRD
jgi:ketol-acid reductoisomerase